METLSKHDLDENIEEFKKIIKSAFPNITKQALNKNWLFIELLEEYTNETIHWISDFLDNKFYNLESCKLANSKVLKFTKQQVLDIESWKHNIWIKYFYENKIKTENGIKIDIKDVYAYYIIAEKKNKFSIEWLKDKLSDILWNKLWYQNEV